MKGDLGDFQTPPALVAAVLKRLGPVGERWPRVLEPTCGRGHFLEGLLALETPPREIVGVEIQGGHLDAARDVARRAPATVRIALTEGSVFGLDLSGNALGWRGGGPLLVVGNPPWVTNAALGALGSGNRPKRSNLKGLRGLDAVTGASNFDTAEAVWIKLLTGLAHQRPTVALLCKTAVARNVLEHAAATGMPVAEAFVVRFDAKAWFGVSVEACLLCVTLGEGPTPGAFDRVPVFDGFGAAEPYAAMGFARGRLVADLDAYARFAHADGVCPLVWRQGVKHDAAGLMELTGEPGSLVNKRGVPVEVEPGYVYPLLKGTDLSRPGPVAPGRRVVVTQRSMGDDTGRLRGEAPGLWKYLQAHAGEFAARKSSIYRGRPAFAMFGIGPYCFAAYKVAVSGLHKAPVFHTVGPEPATGRPVLLDDTGYFLACRSPEQAALAAELLNGPDAVGLLRTLAMPGAKRPLTKATLRRVDLSALLGRSDRAALLERAGAEVVRLTGRSPDWPESLESLFESGPESLPSAAGPDR